MRHRLRRFLVPLVALAVFGGTLLAFSTDAFASAYYPASGYSDYHGLDTQAYVVGQDTVTLSIGFNLYNVATTTICPTVQIVEANGGPDVKWTGCIAPHAKSNPHWNDPYTPAGQILFYETIPGWSGAWEHYFTIAS